MILKYLCGISVLLAVITALPSSENFGDRARPLVENGINCNDTAKFEASKSFGNMVWSNCGAESDLGKIIAVSITPNPPKKGESLNLEATFMLGEEVKGGSLKIKTQLIVYGISITVAKDSYDLCGTELGLQCPIKAGQATINYRDEVQPSTPSGRYALQIVATSDRGDPLICFKLKFTLMS